MKNKNRNKRSVNNFVFVEKKGYDFVKRIFDIVASAIMLICLAPILLIVALLVMTDGGPPIFTHTRVGKNGKLFKMFKFRTMIVGADSEQSLEELQELNEMDGPAFKIQDDPRITKI